MNTEKTKKEFEKPVAEIRRFSVCDVIRTSPISMPFDPFAEDEDEDY